MKTITYGLFNGKADRTSIEISHKIWRFLTEPVRIVAPEVDRVSLLSIDRSAQIAAYQCAKDRYDSKQQEFQQAEQQAFLAYESGNTEAGNLAMGSAIAIKLTLPELVLQLKQAEQALNS
jgi:phage shock protein A